MTLTIVESKESSDVEPSQELARGLWHVLLYGQQFTDLRAKELQLGSSDLVALSHLHSAGPMAPKELSALMGVTSGTMTALLDRVEKAGFLKRERNRKDRRGLLIHLTPAGQHSVQWLHEQFETVIRHTLTKLPAPRIDDLCGLLVNLSGTLEDATRDSEATVRQLHHRTPHLYEA